jgi:hypothetical protein
VGVAANLKVALYVRSRLARAGLPGAAQPAKAAPFAGGNEADVRKTAAGLFF